MWVSLIGQFANTYQKSVGIYKGISSKGIFDFSQCHISNFIYDAGVFILL